MPILHVRNVPLELYGQLKELARQDHCSLTVEVISLLERAVEQRRLSVDQDLLLREIYENRYTPSAAAPRVEDLIREDRER